MRKSLDLSLLSSLAAVLLIMGSNCFASERSLIYRFYEDQSGELIHKVYVQIEELPSGEQSFVQRMEGDDYVARESFILDKDHVTKTMTRTRAGEDTDYTVERHGRTLMIKGRFKGQVVNLSIDLDDKPYYDNPEFNLTQFALSHERHIKFWMLRRDRLTQVLMQAKKREEETLLINGKEMDVIKIACTRSGIREKHFKRFYYFRKSDGLFVKQVTSTGLVSDLISEHKSKQMLLIH